MRVTLKPVLLSAVLFLLSCRDKDAFTIGGRILNAGKVNKVYLMVEDSTGIQMADSTNLSENDEFTFHGTTLYPNLYKLRVGGLLFDLIMQNGDQVQFRTDLKDAGHGSTIEGSPASFQLQEWDAISEQYAAHSQAVLEQYQDKLQQPGADKDALYKIYSPKYVQINSELAKKTINFAKAHQHSLAGFCAITALDPKKYEAERVAYADAIPEELKGTPAIAHFSKEMALIKPVAVGQHAPEIKANVIDGRTIKLSDLKGSYVMVDFWASWCPPCRQENPNLVKLYKQFHPKGLQLLGVSLDTVIKEWQDAIKADQLNWTQVSDLRRFDGATEKRYHIEEIPANFIIDPAGKIIAKNLFGDDLKAFLHRIFG